MARSNRNHGSRRDSRPQRFHTRERLREGVERRGGASAAPSPAPQAADAGGGSAREGEASGFRARGDYIDPRFAMFQAFSNSLMGSVRLREEMERRMREALAGGFRDVDLGTEREWSPPCPYIPGADVSHKTSNGLLVVLDCTLFGDDWHEGMAEGLHECGTGRSGPLVLSPSQTIFVWFFIASLTSGLTGIKWDFCGSICLRVGGRQGGEARSVLRLQSRLVLGGDREVQQGV